MSRPDLHVDGCTVSLLRPREHAAQLQDLYERCTDYHELHEGFPTRPTAGEEELVTVPVGKTLADKFAFGIYCPDGRLVGFLDLIRDFPGERGWWLGLLMLDPAVRRVGLGTRIYRGVVEWVRAQGADTVQLGVLEHNPDAERFWHRQGFEEVRRQPHTSDTGYRSRIIVMRHRLGERD